MAMELLQSFIERLKTVEELGAEAVFGVEKLEEAMETTSPKLRTPSAYVILLREAAAPNEHITLVDQRVISAFGVILAVENTLNPRRMMGGGEISRLQEIRTVVRESLLGYQPDAACDPTEYVIGKLIRLENNVLWWREEFVTAYYIRSQQ